MIGDVIFQDQRIFVFDKGERSKKYKDVEIVCLIKNYDDYCDKIVRFEKELVKIYEFFES